MSRWVIEDMNSVPETCKIHKCTMYWHGDWYCPECLKEEEYDIRESEARWWNSGRLCQECANFDGENRCKKYPNMDYQMFRRKNKCKYFKKIDWSKEPICY